jgi:hypothetical protein
METGLKLISLGSSSHNSHEYLVEIQTGMMIRNSVTHRTSFSLTTLELMMYKLTAFININSLCLL